MVLLLSHTHTHTLVFFTPLIFHTRPSSVSRRHPEARIGHSHVETMRGTVTSPGRHFDIGAVWHNSRLLLLCHDHVPPSCRLYKAGKSLHNHSGGRTSLREALPLHPRPTCRTSSAKLKVNHKEYTAIITSFLTIELMVGDWHVE